MRTFLVCSWTCNQEVLSQELSKLEMNHNLISAENDLPKIIAELSLEQIAMLAEHYDIMIQTPASQEQKKVQKKKGGKSPEHAVIYLDQKGRRFTVR